MEKPTNIKKTKLIVSMLVAAVVVCVAVILSVCLICLPNNKKLNIFNLNITFNNEVINECDVEVYDTSIRFSSLINNEEVNKKKMSVKLSWKIEGDNLNCSINNNGEFVAGDTIGEVNVILKAESKNVVSYKLKVNLVPKANSELQSITVNTKAGFTQNYIEGQTFNRDSVDVLANFGDYNAHVVNFTASNAKLTMQSTEIGITYNNKLFTLPISVQEKSLQSIEIISASNKTEYIEGQVFEKAGMKVLANFEFLNEEVFNFEVDEVSPLLFNNNEVVVSYTYKNITKTTTQKIIVNKRQLTSIELDASKVKKEYTQGEIFDDTGLIVVAHYNSGLSEQIRNYNFSREPLTSNINSVTISYTENNITKTEKVLNIIVNKPYSLIRKVYVSTPNDVNLTWQYTYMDDSGKEVNDNAAFEEHGLIFDSINGIYEIPVGATVMIIAKNATVTDFEIDGIKQNLGYEQTSMSFILERGNDLTISTIKTENKITISFEGDNKEQSFVYFGSWNAPLVEKDYKTLALIYKATEDYYYIFNIDNNEYTLVELAEFVFNKSTKVVVTKQIKTKLEKSLELNYYEGFLLVVDVNIETVTIENLPLQDRAGYTFDGWSLTVDGETLTTDELKTYLLNETNCKIYALWKTETVNYEGKEFIGPWQITISEDGITLICTVEFKADGTFNYNVTINGELNNAYVGLYRFEENKINVTYAEKATDKDIMLIALSNFSFVLKEGKLQASIFMLDSESLTILTGDLDKINV